MESLPEVSVVVPTRFRPELVTRAVRSALAQTVGAIEVIVVIDGPDEPTSRALALITDARLRVVVVPEPGGAPNARNVGVRAARAPWTALLDDDDEWLPHKLAVQLDAARGAKTAMPVVASRLINRTPRADSVLPRRLPAPGEPVSEYLTVRRGLFYGDGFIQTSTIMAPTVLLRREPFTVGLRRMQELDWVLRAVHHEDIELVFAAEPLVIFHQDENRPRITLNSPWEGQLEWLRRSRHLVTPRAYAALIMSVISSMAAPTRNARIFAMLLREARRHGRPGAIDYLTFLQIWLIPPKLRASLRDLMLGNRRGQRPAAAPAVPAAVSSVPAGVAAVAAVAAVPAGVSAASAAPAVAGVADSGGDDVVRRLPVRAARREELARDGVRG